MNKIGVIGIPGKWSTEELANAVEIKTGHRFVMDMRGIYYDVNREELFIDGLRLSEFDALIIKKLGEVYSPNLFNRISLLGLLEKKGTRIFSKPKNIARLLNRLDCTLELQSAGIPVPDTILTENIDEAIQAVQKFGKVVLKPLFTSKARGMRVVENAVDTRQIIEDFMKKNPMCYLQKFIQIPGKDLGITFLGGKYLGTYARVGQKGQWNTTTRSGGKYEPYEPGQDLIDLAYQAQRVFDLDFTGVDLVETEEGPKIFEVSAFGGFRGLVEAKGINVAKKYVDYVLKELGN